MQIVLPAKSLTIDKRGFRQQPARPSGRQQAGAQIKRGSRQLFKEALVITAIAGDLAMIVLGFVFAFWTRFQSGWIPNYTDAPPNTSILENYKLILLGTIIVFWGFLRKGLYAPRTLLFSSTALKKFIAPLSISLLVFIGISLSLRTDPPISRTFVACAWLSILLTVVCWRFCLGRILTHPALQKNLRQRLVVIGGGRQTLEIKTGLSKKSDMEFVGWVQAIRANSASELGRDRLGSLHELGDILRKNAVDIVVLTESESLQREGVMSVARTCEMEHVQFKMVPHFFDILISGICPDTIGGVGVLGMDCLPLNALRNRAIKRAVDIVGAVVGIILSAPLMLFFGLLVYLESPGPVFYRQVRSGQNGRLFSIIKIRSMRLDAEGGGKAKWAQENDPRRLRIGAFLRKWNIDEVPQFWNVLKGEMSLVGPRPERPELIEKFKTRIPHYQARHTCPPGVTGWAQVNGWRGNTDLEQRIRHDIWYVENWSVLLDFRILLLTFFKRKNAY